MGYNSKYNRLNHQEIVDQFNELKSIKDISIRHNISEELVKKVLVNNGINLPKKVIIGDMDPTKIIERYRELHNTQIVAKEFNISPTSVQKILHKNNIKISVIKYTDEEIIKKYKELKTIHATEKELRIGEKTIRNVLRKYNVELEVLKRKKIGDVFGKLTIIEEVESKIGISGSKRRQFILKCECGNLVKRNSLKLSNGKSRHCGCVTKERINKRNEEKRIRRERYEKLIRISNEKKRNLPPKKPKKKYFVGSVKGRLTILSISDDKWESRKITCKCECGTIKEMFYKNIYTINSCGCLSENRVKSSTIHGHSSKKDNNRRKWYDRWKSMVKRCYNPKCSRYEDYGGRGIQICDRWREPNGIGCENYYNDIHTILGPQPSPEHTLDRINNDGNYEITNLRWATYSEQRKNQRGKKFLKKPFMGKS
jgi:hypothetical protein